MNNTTFIRKAAYCVLIAILLIPLSLISRPATWTASSQGVTNEGDQGGKLAQLRDQYDLSQAKLMEIDPASETMKLASVGLKGIAVNILWMQAVEHRKLQNWDALRATLNALVKIQPNFIKVWEYQAHNLSYNISVEFDDYEYRYHWVKEGIKFLTEGIPYNYRNHRITDNLGFFSGMKIGRSDEKSQFRRLFRRDNDFHEELYLTDGRGVDPGLYETREYGHDNWKMAYQWYEKSRGLVEKYPEEQYLNDMMFYRKRPMQLMNQARGLQEEFPTDDIIQDIWGEANQEWTQFGQREIRTSKGIPLTFEGLAEMQSQLSVLRDQLDELVPGFRDGYMQELQNSIGFSSEQLDALAIPPDERSEEQAVIATTADNIILKRSRGIDLRIAENASPNDLATARRLAEQIERVMTQMQFAESYSETVNYKYWGIRSETESRDIAADARRAMYAAQEMKRGSIFDDEFQFDPNTKEKKLVKQGAISLYEDAFVKWQKVLDDPQVKGTELVDGELVDDLVNAAADYYDMLRITGREWPENFPFQDFVDAEVALGELKLPTSQDVADRISGRTESVTEDDAPVPAADSEIEQPSPAEGGEQDQ